MKVCVDYELCQGHGVCEAEAPEVFEVQADGTLKVLQEQPPESLHDQVRKAEEYCPTQAISLEE